MSEPKHHNIQKMNMQQLHYKRKIKNLLINPKFQLKFTCYFFVVGMALMGILTAIVFSKLRDFQLAISRGTMSNQEVHDFVYKTMIDILFNSSWALGAFAMVVFTYSILISHRVAGPTVAIVNRIESLKRGDFTHRHLRKYDELQPIMESLNDLADHMEGDKSLKGKL